ncbi:hypothetical protein [Pseudescherichia sp. L3]|uniref:hypothetical protein n=1 Tax=Pseudescherichia sp. L3 TaxID=2970817 RepID=UPI0021502438|nr:hypothetical protein [Pseudescherichia sp. L3]MCR4457561.1 hypothetical protein [Pseudescherichia sp. L3]
MSDFNKKNLADKTRRRINLSDEEYPKDSYIIPDGGFEIRENKRGHHIISDGDDLPSKKIERISFDSADQTSDEIAALRERK